MRSILGNVCIFSEVCVMLKKYGLLFLFVAFGGSYTNAQVDSTFVDPKYLEDQLYFGLTYNFMVSQPDDFNQNGISGGITVGFIRDIPLNEGRNIGLGLGLGYAYNMFNSNLIVAEDINDYQILPNESFTTNRLYLHSLEVPFEFRWRTSTATTYNFWRIYTGVKFGYVFSSTSNFSDDSGTTRITNISGIREFNYGFTFSAGYSTFNLHVYYALNPIFEDVQIEGETIDLTQLSVGLMFYIL